MGKALEDLRHEHEAIVSALGIMDSIVAQIGRGAHPETKDLKELIDFLKEFADRCHHGKEEGILFPALAKAGIPEEGGPIGVMRAEHLEGRRLISEMESAIGGTVDHAGFAAAARAYSTLLRSHIRKENNVLFPAAERALGSSQLEEIHIRFEEHEEKVIGQGRHEALHEVLKRLKKKYASA